MAGASGLVAGTGKAELAALGAALAISVGEAESPPRGVEVAVARESEAGGGAGDAA